MRQSLVAAGWTRTACATSWVSRGSEDAMASPPAVSDLLAEPRRRVTLEEVRSRRDEILAAGERHGVTRVRVFGSVARGDATESSDLDLLVDVAPGRSLLDLASFAIEVQDLMAVFTQVVTVAGLRERIRPRVLDEAVPL